MIYYFSATGNSKLLALTLAKHLGVEAIDLAGLTINDGYTPLADTAERIGFVFPVYGWSIPNIVKHFLTHLIYNREHVPYIFCAMTCGDDVGMTDKHIIKALAQSGMHLDAAFSLVMPDSYVCLPGFDVDKDELRRSKLSQFHSQVRDIAAMVERKQRVISIKRGALPRTKTYVLGGLFRRFLVSDKPFHTTTECVGCGKCEKVCPLKNISLDKSNAPIWHGKCTGCLSCYHHCPMRAIRFGRQTNNKGQYLLDNYLDEVDVALADNS